MRRSRVLWLAAPTALLLVVGAAAAGAYAYDQHRSGVMLPGVVIGGVPVGDLTRRAALDAVSQATDAGLDAPLDVRIGGYAETVTPRLLGAGTDAERQVDAALGQRNRLGLPGRVWHRLTGRSVRADRAVHRTVDDTVMSAYLRTLASRIEKPAVDASLQTDDGFVHVTPSFDGYDVDEAAALTTLRRAVAHGDRSVVLPGRAVLPTTRGTELATVILVRVGENKLYFYKNGQLDRTYGVATGMAQYPTPIGTFKVVNRLMNPTWVNPAKYKGGWGYTLPDRIGPGPRNPLGTRALALNTSGVLIHGTVNVASIGYNASHGCIRMKMHDVEELFPLVPAGTPVVILRAAPDRIPGRQSTLITTPDAVAGAPTAQAAPTPPPAPPPPTTTTTTH